MRKKIFNADQRDGDGVVTTISSTLTLGPAGMIDLRSCVFRCSLESNI